MASVELVWLLNPELEVRFIKLKITKISTVYVKLHLRTLVLYLSFRTCFEVKIGNVCSYLRHKHKL